MTRARWWSEQSGHVRDLLATRGLMAALVVGAVVRLGTFVAHPPLNVDEARYLVVAHHGRHGMGYSDWNGPETDIMPLHPFLTAVLGGGPATLERNGRTVACVASILALVALAVVAARVAGRGPALVATWMVALHPWVVRAAGRPQPESLYTLLVAMALLCMATVLAGRTRPHAWSCVASGLLMGLAYLARPEGFLVGIAALAVVVAHGHTRLQAAAAGACFALGLLAPSIPYMVWLREQVGHWTVTGKAEEMFYVGQAMNLRMGEPPLAGDYLLLQEQYGPALRFVVTEPVHFLAGVVRMGTKVIAGTLPRALGPLGLLGWVGFALLTRSSRSSASRILWTCLPALVLIIMVATCPNERVAGSIVPFLMIPAGVGVVDLCSRLPARGGIRASAMLIVVALLLIPWVPAVTRAMNRGAIQPRDIERNLAEVAMLLEPQRGAILTNNPVISYHLNDPTLFGPPGRYRPIELGQNCASLGETMDSRGARIAIVDQWSGGRSVVSECRDRGLESIVSASDPGTGRFIEVIRRNRVTTIQRAVP